MNRFENWERPVFDNDGWTKYGWRCHHHENLKLGKNVDIGCFSYLMASNGIIIEDSVQIGSGVRIYSVDTIDNVSGTVILKEKCKIGANSVILPNCVVGKNSVIGACSMLQYSTIIPGNEIWVGVPVHKIGNLKNEQRVYL